MLQTTITRPSREVQMTEDPAWLVPELEVPRPEPMLAPAAAIVKVELDGRVIKELVGCSAF